MTEQITNPDLRFLKEYLDLSTMTLGSTGPEGQPHVAPVYFVADKAVNLYFFSKPTSQHIRDVEQNAAASIAIYPECFDWQEIRGVQMRGNVKPVVHQVKAKQLIRLYSKKFSFVSNLGMVLTENRMYQFRPEWIRVVDNRVRFGHKIEFAFAAG